MAASFFFYDLETSGISSRTARIMQFAGQRTDLRLQPIGDPVNILIKLTPDVLPEPDAVLLTGITPQQTLSDGISEAEFLKIFYDQVVKPDTIFVGYNNIRFDDEFIRFINYRNFYDAYGWHWRNGCSRWDLLDVVRMTRALRPDGITWPFASDGKPTNRLEYLTKTNKLDHSQAHDALSDVQATIAVAQLIKDQQPDLFKYLLDIRDKKKVAELVKKGEPFTYTSSHYSSQFLHTTAVAMLCESATGDGALVYDLRQDPTPFIKMSIDELAKAWQFTRDEKVLRLPVKNLKYNRCPAIAPLGVIKDDSTQKRLALKLDQISTNLQIFNKNRPVLSEKVLSVVERLDKERQSSNLELLDNPLDVDERLYDGFLDDNDQRIMVEVIKTLPDKLASLAPKLHDSRLKSLLPLYQARNFPASLDSEQQVAWNKHLHQKLMTGDSSSLIAKYFARLAQLAETRTDKHSQYLLEELQLYGQSIIAFEEFDNVAD